MTLETAACSQPVIPENPEQQIAESVVADLAPGFTETLCRSIVCDLMGRLSAEKEQRRARNMNHWEEYAPRHISALAEQLLTERGEKITAYLKAHVQRLNELAWRVTRDIDLADQAVARTTWELWEGRTHEEVCYRALKMNARNLLEKRATGLRRSESLDGMLAAATARGEDLDFPSHRLDDQDPLEILLAREEQQETCDELTYAIQNLRRSSNWWILQTKWWQSSGLAELERTLQTSDFGGSPE